MAAVSHGRLRRLVGGSRAILETGSLGLEEFNGIVLHGFGHRGIERLGPGSPAAGHVYRHDAAESSLARRQRQQRPRNARRLLPNINVSVFKDGSAEVEDDGRGMPVDIHPKEKISGVELILTRLHAGGKFNDKTYQHSGGLHGVGVSVVNVLSKHLECWVRRGGKEYNVSFKGGRLASKLEVVR